MTSVVICIQRKTSLIYFSSCLLLITDCYNEKVSWFSRWRFYKRKGSGGWCFLDILFPWHFLVFSLQFSCFCHFSFTCSLIFQINLHIIALLLDTLLRRSKGMHIMYWWNIWNGWRRLHVINFTTKQKSILVWQKHLKWFSWQAYDKDTELWKETMDDSFT